MWGGALASPPSGWLVCDGSAVSRTTYSALYAIVGDAFGNGNGSTTFNLPNFTNRFPYGANEGASAGNASVGSKNTRSGAEGALSGNDDAVTFDCTQDGSATSGGDVYFASEDINMMPPYLAVGFIIKT